MSALGAVIRDGLADAGLSQGELADMLGVSDTTVNRWVLGQRVPMPTIVPILAKVLGHPEIEALASVHWTTRAVAQAQAWAQRRVTMEPKPPKERKAERRRTLDVWSLTPPRRNATHLVEDVSFAPGMPQDQAPVSCRCGWSGITGDWMDHRREDAA